MFIAEYEEILESQVRWTHSILGASLNLYSGRAPFTKKEITFQFLGEAGLDEDVLIRLIRSKAAGLPAGITEESVRKYWRDIGPDSTKLMSSISRQHTIQRDYDIPFNELLPNQSVTIDIFEAQFSKVNKSGRSETVPALNGDLKVLLSVDTKSGAVRISTLKSIKNPELILKRTIDDYGVLRELWADKSFVTAESLALCKRLNVRLHQFVPGQHNIYGGRVEGIGRWVKEGAQTCWNKVLEVVARKEITIQQAKRLWRHCWIFAVQVINLRASLHDPEIMRFFYVYGRKFSLINDCIMPFMTPLIIYKLRPTDTGRGAKAYYLCRSETVGTGIVVYDPITESTSVVAPFKVSTHDANKGTPADLTAVALELHGRFSGSATSISSAIQPVEIRQGTAGGGVGVGGGGDQESEQERILEETEISKGPIKRKVVNDRVTVEATRRRVMEAEAERAKEKAVKAAQDRDSRDKERSIKSAIAHAAQQALLDEENSKRERNKVFNDMYISRIAKEVASGGVLGQQVRPETIEEASANFRSRLQSIKVHRDLTATSIDRCSTGIDNKRTILLAGLGRECDVQIDDMLFDNWDADTNRLVHMAIMDVQEDYARITRVLLTDKDRSSSEIEEPLSKPIFDPDPGGVHAMEDQRVMDAFARHQITFILNEEIVYSEQRVYLEDLIGDYDAHNKEQEAVDALEESKLDATEVSARPPKPNIPGPSMRKTSELWAKALRREVDKLIAYDVMVELPRDPVTRRYIRPDGAIVQRLLEVAEYKWKVDPDTGLTRWLECIRIVVDGSKDLRPDNFYALTPDRTMLFVILAVTAMLGHPSSTADVERAYLNAFSLDKNLVVLAGSHMFPLSAESLLIKALYGSKAGALGWEVHIDAIMESLGYVKMAIARGVYLKYHQETGDLIRAYRHSDDFYLTSACQIVHKAEGDLIRSKIGMSPFTIPLTFLGLECERRHHITGELLPEGKLVLIRQTTKIEQAEVMFAPAFEKYFPRHERKVSTPVPLDYNLDVSLLSPLMSRPLEPKEKTLLQSVTGVNVWITSSCARYGTFGTYIAASSVSEPIVRDLYNSLYLLKFIIQEKHCPLVLGGDGPIDINGMTDCSLGTGAKGKSVVSYFGRLHALGGAIGSFTTATNFALTNISHGETEGMVKCTHLLMYVKNALVELGYHVPDHVLIEGDNSASINWTEGGATSGLSRHVCQRIMAIRDYKAKGISEYKHVRTVDNTSDIGTKAMGPGIFHVHMRNIQGHRLLDNLPLKILGVKEIANPEFLDELIMYLDTVGSYYGDDHEGKRITLSDVLLMKEQSDTVDEIEWTMNDYSLSYGHLFKTDTIAEEQPLLMFLNEDGSAPFTTNN